MTKMIVQLLLVISLVAGAVASVKGVCCPEDQQVENEDEPLLCLDAKTNVTTSLPLTCNSTIVIYPAADLDFRVEDNGTLFLSLQDMDFGYEPGKFCVFNRSRVDVASGETREERSAVICHEQLEELEHAEGTSPFDFARAYCLIVSAVLLLVTACIYIGLPELRDLQGKSIINFCLSLGAGLGALASNKLVVQYTDMNLCAARGFFTYYFLIAAFFWSNAISFQILLRTRNPSKSYGWKEFAWYAIYAWGCPSILTISMAIVNFMPGRHRKPGIGLNHCWFYDRKLQWEYMYSVMTIILLVNICIFIYTSFLLWKHSFQSSSQLKAIRYKFMMTMRLCLIMGIPWIFEMISQVSPDRVIWMIFDIINSLQGLFLFFVLVVFRPSVFKLMHQHRWLQCLPGSVDRWLAVPPDEMGEVEHTMGMTMDGNDHGNQ